MIELKNKACIFNELIVLSAYFLNISWKKSYNKENKGIRGRGCGAYPSRQVCSKIYSHYHVSGYSEPTCLKKYYEKSPNA